jgi:hypothetical protein
VLCIPPSSVGHWYLCIWRTAMCFVLGLKFLELLCVVFEVPHRGTCLSLGVCK